MTLNLQTLQPLLLDKAGHSLSWEQSLLEHGRRLTESHRLWREQSSRWPTDAQFEALDPLYDAASALLKELESQRAAIAASPAKTELSKLHWDLQMMVAVPMEKLRQSTRRGEGLERALTVEGASPRV